MKNRYLPNLNALRAISVFVVLIGHATSLQAEFGGFRYLNWLHIPGKFGVIVFFCISGILISHLIDRERSETGDVGIKQFYLRRIARIWPLYFLIAIPALILNALTTGTIHTAMVWKDYLAIFLILPGFADRPMFMGQTWSIGVEESFYALYPLMFRYLSKRALVLSLSIVVVAPDFFSALGPHVCGNCINLVRFYWSPVFYSTIAIGCLAYLAYSHKNETFNRLLFSPAVQCTAFAFVAVTTAAAILTDNERYFDYRLDALAFSVVILNGAFNKDTIFQMENRVTRFLGEISYGMYMYHVYCICLTLLICRVFFKGESFAFQNFIVDALTIAMTVVVSKLSYDFIESPIRTLAKKRSRHLEHGMLRTAEIEGGNAGRATAVST